MSEAKHTPAPWVTDERFVGSVYSDDKTGSIVARTCGKGFEYAPRSGEEVLANARLIAAAPDLLAALKAMLAMDWRVGPEKSEYDLAEAAIAKAEGVGGINEPR